MNQTVTITNERLNLFVLAGKAYVNNQKRSVLWVAVETLLETAIERLKKVERKRELARIGLCKKSASKHIETDKNGRYQFTEENHKLLRQHQHT